MLFNQTVFALAVHLMKNYPRYGGRLPDSLAEARRFVANRWDAGQHFAFAEWIDRWTACEAERRATLRIFRELSILRTA